MITMEELLTTEDVARILRVDIDTARKMLRSGEIPGAFKFRHGRQWKISAENLRRFIAQQEQQNNQ